MVVGGGGGWWWKVGGGELTSACALSPNLHNFLFLGAQEEAFIAALLRCRTAPALLQYSELKL